MSSSAPSVTAPTDDRQRFKPNYRCCIPFTKEQTPGCPDFFLPYKDPGCVFICPSCGSPRLLPLWG